MHLICQFSLMIAFQLLMVSAAAGQGNWKPLFNGKDLTGWDTYLGPYYDTVKNDWGKERIGLNSDPGKVFSVTQKDGFQVMRISGEHFGGISTKNEFSNYHLRMQFKWGNQKSAPKKTSKRDSGILYHAVGLHGADFGFWMRSQEFQVQEGDCGDYWGVAGGSFDIPARAIDSATYVFDPKGQMLTFNEKSRNGRRCIKAVDAENPTGEWNTAEIYCHGDTAVHMMNGKVVMVLYRSGQLENDKVVPLTGGKIQIQSEGAEIFYRNIEIRSITRLPDELIKLN
jgi:hypothetical protein